MAGEAMIKQTMGPSSLSQLRQRLPRHPTPPTPSPGLVPAGVLVPLFLKAEELYLLFTQRTLTVKDHRGQNSFPGGVQDPGDPDLLATALRETEEEIGLDHRVVEVLGTLPPVDTITGYTITAFVGFIPHPYEFHPNPREVERLLTLPLEGFIPPERWSSGVYHYQGRITRVCCWRLNHEVIWGATARILLNLLAQLGHHPIPGDPDATCQD
jgi:8-oxo-dGTP pyrophosphatase MutT (NUDIX family)